MKIITFEEHHDDPDICAAVMKATNKLPSNRRAQYTIPPSFGKIRILFLMILVKDVFLQWTLVV